MLTKGLSRFSSRSLGLPVGTAPSPSTSVIHSHPAATNTRPQVGSKPFFPGYSVRQCDASGERTSHGRPASQLQQRKAAGSAADAENNVPFRPQGQTMGPYSLFWSKPGAVKQSWRAQRVASGQGCPSDVYGPRQIFWGDAVSIKKNLSHSKLAC